MGCPTLSTHHPSANPAGTLNLMEAGGISKPGVVIFDNDGTLIPSHITANPAIRAGFAEFCRRHGIEAEVPSDERIRDLTGQPGEVFYRSLLPQSHIEWAPELRQFCLDREVIAMRERASFYPGLEEMLSRLRAGGIQLAVATHGGRSYIEAVGERLDYPRRFDRVFYHGKDGLRTKSKMIIRAIDELGTRDGIFVGDRRADAEAAQEVGIPFIGCLYGYGSEEELSGATVSVPTSEALAEFLLRHV